MLIDPFARRIAYLRLSVTDFCNYRCVYCLPDGYQGCGSADELSLAEIRTLVAAFAACGTEKIRLTGGEPTLRADIADIIRICASTPGIQKVALTTNGHRLAEHYPALLDAGIDQINLSVDSFRAATFQRLTGKNHLPALLATIDALLARGYHHLKLNALLMRDSATELYEDTLAYLKTRPLTMRYIELMQTGDNAALYQRAHISAAHITARLLADGWQERERSPLAGPAREYHHPDYTGRIGIIAPYEKTFCTTCNRLRVTAHGQMHLCLFDSINYDLRPWLRAGDSEGLIARLHQLIAHKPEHHHLHEQNPGIMRHLAQIGG
ncbi:GTP 3',8-cyclase MoaA [Cardiobacterium hominis]|uniref:GTP 3',8-cyclase MoaA n=1 Tax=Cardiobacterium hominis TaxID=2718 RepID=UPI002492B023|nr:GTP 3',8-cyclase MoaA [Cardiobacterium hominis]